MRAASTVFCARPRHNHGAINLTVASRRAETEPGTSGIVPAVTGAIFTATGKRL
jgi:hypothetical protein